MHEKDCLYVTGLFDESLRALEDMDCWIRMSRKYKFAHIKKLRVNLPGRKTAQVSLAAKGLNF